MITTLYLDFLFQNIFLNSMDWGEKKTPPIFLNILTFKSPESALAFHPAGALWISREETQSSPSFQTKIRLFPFSPLILPGWAIPGLEGRCVCTSSRYSCPIHVWLAGYGVFGTCQSRVCWNAATGRRRAAATDSKMLKSLDEVCATHIVKTMIHMKKCC